MLDSSFVLPWTIFRLFTWKLLRSDERIRYPCKLDAMFDVIPEKSDELLANVVAILTFFLGTNHAHPNVQMGHKKPRLKCIRKFAVLNEAASNGFLGARMISSLCSSLENLVLCEEGHFFKNDLQACGNTTFQILSS
jgi:hypothetical protein